MSTFFESYPELASLDQVPKKLVVFLHGVGADGHDLISLAPLMQPDLPYCHFISPHGIEPFDMAPFGRQWFSIANRDPFLIKKLVEKNSPSILSIIQNKQKALNLTNKDTIIIGFSQGTMIGLYLSLTQEEPFDKIIGFSGLLIPPDDCLNTVTPVCLIHGEEDQSIDVQEMNKAAEYLKAHKIKCFTHKIPYLGHSIDNKGINLAIEFINSSQN